MAFDPTLCLCLSLSFTIIASCHCFGGDDNCAILDCSQRHLKGHSWTYLRDICLPLWYADMYCGGRGILQIRCPPNLFKSPLLSVSGWNPKLHNYHHPLVKAVATGPVPDLKIAECIYSSVQNSATFPTLLLKSKISSFHSFDL